MRSFFSRASTLAAILFGLVGGIGIYTFMYANGAAYLKDDPSACANCHIMWDQYNGWTKGSHKAVATCNDCHAPHSSLPAKLFVKGLNGWNHSVAFTTGRFPDPIRITDMNRRVTESACRYCHEDLTHAIDQAPHVRGRLECIRCHSTVGHT